MTTFIVTVPREELDLFHRPGLDLQTGQLLELAGEHPRQLDLFANLPHGGRLPLATILRALSNRYTSAFRQTGDIKCRERGRAYLMVAVAVDELPSGHPLFSKLDHARVVGGDTWAELEQGFVEGLGVDVDLPMANYPSLVFVPRLEGLLDQFRERLTPDGGD